MFCPTCRCEFRPSFTRCASCDVDLVDDLAVPEKEGEAVAPNPVTQLPMVDICGYFDLAEARHARDLLHEHRIAGELAIRASPATPHDGAVVEEYWPSRVTYSKTTGPRRGVVSRSRLALITK